MAIGGDDNTSQHLTAEEVQVLLGFVQRFRPIIVGGQAINIWAELYSGKDGELDSLGELTSKDIDFYHNPQAERALADGLEDGLLLIPSGDTHTPNAAVVTGKLGNRSVVVDFLAQIKGVTDSSLINNSITFADSEDPQSASITLMHPLDCVRSRFSNINMLGRRSPHSVRQAVASLLILDIYIDDQLSNPQDRPAIKRAFSALCELEFIIRDLHMGQTTDVLFGDKLRPVSIVEKYCDDQRFDARLRAHQLSGILNRLRMRQDRADRRRDRGTSLSSAAPGELRFQFPARPMIILEIKANIRGNDLATLLHELAQSREMVKIGFAIQGEIAPEARLFLERLEEAKVSDRFEQAWPGTVLFGGHARILEYSATGFVVDEVIRLAEGLFDWSRPAFPEDLFMKSDNMVLLETTGHERFGLIRVETVSPLLERLLHNGAVSLYDPQADDSADRI